MGLKNKTKQEPMDVRTQCDSQSADKGNYSYFSLLRHSGFRADKGRGES
jgi:hypothetical protein